MNDSASPPPDLSKLRIDRGLAPLRRRRRRRWITWGVLALVIVAAGAFMALRPKVAEVQTTPVVTTYPSQQYVVLNATGRRRPSAGSGIGST